MTDIDIDISKLSIPARETMMVIDTYINMMDGTIRAGELKLYCDRWDELDRSISYQSDRDYNLTDFTWRGVKIVSWDGA